MVTVEFNTQQIEDSSHSSNSDEHLNDTKKWTERDQGLKEITEEISDQDQSEGKMKKAVPALKKRYIAKQSQERHVSRKSDKQMTFVSSSIQYSTHEKKKVSSPDRDPHYGNHHNQYSSNHHAHSSDPLASLSTVTMDTNPEDVMSGLKPSGGAHGDHKVEGGGAGEEFSTVSEKGGNMFEVFQASDGEEYTVYVRDDGKRFYVDFEEQVRTVERDCHGCVYYSVISYRNGDISLTLGVRGAVSNPLTMTPIK